MAFLRWALLAPLLWSCAPDGTLDLFPPDGGGEASADASSDAVGCPLTVCGDRCVDLKRDPTSCGTCGRSCSHNQWCNSGECDCLPGFSRCGTACLALAADPDHCGSCSGSVCTGEQRCEHGACAPGACTGGDLKCSIGGRMSCGTATVPFCRACGVTCAPNEVCTTAGCRRYAPATPCMTCPCTSECTRAIGANARCCDGLGGLICVEGDACP